MSMMLKISAKSGYLHVDATGKFSLAEAKRTFIEMLEAVAQNKVGKVLFDGRGLVGSPEFMERFYYGKFAAETVAQFGARGVSPATEFAYVLEVPMRDPEQVRRNRRPEPGHAMSRHSTISTTLSDGSVFQEYISPTASADNFLSADRRVSFVQDRATWIDLSQGPLERTNNPLDVAVNGKGYLVVQTPRGERYTRNGASANQQHRRTRHERGLPGAG